MAAALKRILFRKKNKSTASGVELPEDLVLKVLAKARHDDVLRALRANSTLNKLIEENWEKMRKSTNADVYIRFGKAGLVRLSSPAPNRHITFNIPRKPHGHRHFSRICEDVAIRRRAFTEWFPNWGNLWEVHSPLPESQRLLDLLSRHFSFTRAYIYNAAFITTQDLMHLFPAILLVEHK